MIGMMWRDANSKESVEAKVDKAATYYTDKYHTDVTFCFVHPSMLGDGISGFTTKSGIEVKIAKWVLPNSFWVGVGEEQNAKNP